MKKGLPKPWQSMSARLLWLTIGFVMVAEVLIFAPSVGRYWETWLEERLAAGHLAVLALAATPNLAISPELEAELLSHVGAYSVSVGTDLHGKLMLMAGEPPQPVARTVDLTTSGTLDLISEALGGLMSYGNQVIRVVGTSPQVSGATVAIVIDDAPLMEDLRQFALRIFFLSLVISLITASLVYLSLHLLLVRPMRRVTENMVAFQDDPESSPIYAATGKRSDEIGLAETALAEMEQGLRDSLRQQSRLAALGIAVSKINHDLRNILTTARLVSDSMADSADPRVRRVAPTLIKSIDRAVDLCARTLAFARGGEMRMETGRVSLPELFTEVRRSLVAPEAEEVDWMVTVPQDLVVQADREQLYRVLANLAQNAVEAGATQLSLTAGVFDDGESWYLRLSDNGPGLPPRARANLFKPFTGSARAGGSGLGLAIVREIVEAHGGRIALVESGPAGTTFALEMPGGVARPEPVEPPRQVAQG